MVSVEGVTGKPSLADVYHERYVPLVRLARLMVGSTAVAEELTQEAFMRLIGAWARVENPAGFVHTTLVNLCRSYFARTAVADRYRPDPVTDQVDPDIDETWNALARLPDTYRVVLALRFYEDLSEAEIARVLQLRPGTVKSQIHRGLAKLRKELS
jgi:RNA polymerase sigma factor (sigma-70 family)